MVRRGRALPGLAFILIITTAHAATPQPDMADPRKDIAFCTDASLTPEQAIQNCSQIIALDDVSRWDRALAHLSRARAHASRGAPDRAIADYDVALTIDADKVEALVERAALHRARGNRRAALLDYTAALKLDPGLADIRAARQDLVLELERLGATMGGQPAR